VIWGQMLGDRHSKVCVDGFWVYDFGLGFQGLCLGLRVWGVGCRV